MMDESFIVMDTEEVFSLVDECLSNIKEKRKKCREVLLDKRMNTWWGRLFFRSKAVLRSRLKQETWSDYNMIDFLEYEREECANTLLVLAEASMDGLVNVSGRDLRKLKG